MSDDQTKMRIVEAVSAPQERALYAASSEGGVRGLTRLYLDGATTEGAGQSSWRVSFALNLRLRECK